MLALQIGDEFLELPKELSLELVEENPFLQFAEDEALGNYTLPYSLNSIPANVRKTDYVAIFQKITDNSGKEVRLWSNGFQHSIGITKTEKVNHNLNNLHAGTQSHYYLFGSSSFYQQIKKKRLRDIDMGGARSFAWDDYATSGPGFWGHMSTLVNSAPNADDYAIYPVINKSWPSGIVPNMDMMNDCDYHDGAVRLLPYRVAPGFLLDITRIVPFPYLHLVMKRAVEYAGWTIEGDIFSDTDFLKVTMINGQAIDWGNAIKTGGAWGVVQRNPVVFNLQDNLPDIEIGAFLVALRKDFGLWYNFDYIKKKIIVSTMNGLTIGEVKDMTKFASPLITKSIDQEKKIYALRTEGGESVDLTNVDFQGNINEISDLPAAAEALYGHAYLVVAENNYYVCLQNEDTEAWEWTLLSYNIFDYAPAGSTDDITTAATTVGMEVYNTVPGDGIPTIPLAPRYDIQGRWFGRTEGAGEEDWGIVLCFYHGTVSNLVSGELYPYGSSHIYDPGMNQVAQWSLAFDCYKTDGTNVGLYTLNWKKFLDIISGPESYEATLYLPLHLAMQLKFSDQIIIAGVKMFVKQIKRSLEYKGMLEIEAVRIF